MRRLELLRVETIEEAARINHLAQMAAVITRPATEFCGIPGATSQGAPSMTRDAYSDSKSFCWSLIARRCNV